MNKLSKRLFKISKLVEGRIVCDVGCDHGKLAQFLLRKNKVDFMYVSDISLPSLAKAIKLLDRYGYTNYRALCCDGLSGYDGLRIDECIIAGMGGEEIIKIISNSPIKINSFILSPQHNIVEVKNYMINKGYAILQDKIIKDGHKFYNIFKCKLGMECSEYSESELRFGKDYNSEEVYDLLDYLDYEEKKVNTLINQVNEERKTELRVYLKLIEKTRKDWKV